MIQQFWVCDNRKITVCVDDYNNGILRGRFYNAYHDACSFESLSQFLIRMESLLEEHQTPQSYTTHRSFCAFLPPHPGQEAAGGRCRGILATFELKVLFRQNSSWQGTLSWLEKKQEKSFRSVLELILLLDSALRQQEGKEAV